MLLKLCIVFCAVNYVFCDTDLNNYDSDGNSLAVPRLDIPNLENGYHGLIKENETVVEVTPKIRAIGAEICSFHIVNKHHGEAPFQIVLKPHGYAQLKAKKTLNCEKRRNYKFDIAAISCEGKQSLNATVHITVIDINEYPPTFLEPSYVRQVDEGRLYEEILRVEASDRDCTPKYGDVCKYEILTNDQPFVIDSEGAIRNTEPLDYDRSHNHILSVVAYDCGMKQSLPVMVTIKVNRLCQLGWKGISERIDYAPMSGKQYMFPSASLDLCDVPCNVKSLHTSVSLVTGHIGKGCDRDTYSVQSQRKICGASPDSIDLLPTPDTGSEWTKPLISDEGHESDQIFEFDGQNSAVAIPNNVLNHELASVFTISTWMKHKNHLPVDKHRKEHILCLADDHKMNRHHYALFVRNCRLILLLRRERRSEGDLNIFRPAEFRWKIHQVCDNQWHHYAVNVRFPDVELYIDGVLFKNEKKNPEIIDDWPLHPTKGINTTLTVGACWQGSDNKMKHHFKGYLAGLNVLLKKTEKPEVLSCLHKCKESLEVPAMELLQPGMELLTNSDLTELSIEGDNKTNLEVLMRKVGYSNTREFPTPGRRNIHVTTSVMCDNGKSVKIAPIESYVMVLQPQTPTINVNGTTNIAREYSDFRQGVRIFADIHVQVLSNDRSKLRAPAQQKLDECSISVYPSLNPDHESVNLPENLLQNFGIVAKITKDGISLTGSDMILNYEQILREIQYINQKPAYYLNRVFKLICSELNGRFVSNEYAQTLTVIHPRLVAAIKSMEENKDNEMEIPKENDDQSKSEEKKGDHLEDIAKPPINLDNQAESIIAKAMVHRHNVEMKPAQILPEEYLSASLTDRTQQVLASGSHAVTIIIVLCVGFLLFMIVLGVIRIRSAQQNGAPFTGSGIAGSKHHNVETGDIQDTEMAWDDSALTITVNPMDMDNAPTAAGVKLSDSSGHRIAGVKDNTMVNELSCSEDDDSCDEEQSEDSDDDSQDDSECDTGRRRLDHCVGESSDDEENCIAGTNGGRRNKYQNVNQLEWDNSTM
ncbi:calsyntenin-1 isoform X2 [Chrysoperla carnea]|uniref:calsyntenin-1 isoform X2 n=1 Tax=Chrysoperla carnea TaxID=189513 RepID=UPI001D05C73F|nr:calsyntenin-1 isoform X2 [Chrysoperla carnea]